jgi:hypothetical protein
MSTKALLEYMKGKDDSEELGVDGRILLKRMLHFRVWTGFM